MLMELGPCSINGPNATQYNPYSWNTNANMLFLEQPVGVSWSTADYGQTVASRNIIYYGLLGPERKTNR